MFCIRLQQVFRVYNGATTKTTRGLSWFLARPRLCFMIKIALATAESVDLAHYTPSPAQYGHARTLHGVDKPVTAVGRALTTRPTVANRRLLDNPRQPSTHASHSRAWRRWAGRGRRPGSGLRGGLRGGGHSGVGHGAARLVLPPPLADAPAQRQGGGREGGGGGRRARRALASSWPCLRNVCRRRPRSLEAPYLQPARQSSCWDKPRIFSPLSSCRSPRAALAVAIE